MTVYCLICGAEYTSNEAVSTHEKGTNWGVCPSCLADARLGRMVRGLAIGGKLRRGNDTNTGFPKGMEWYCMNEFGCQDFGKTPEEALEAAGVKL